MKEKRKDRRWVCKFPCRCTIKGVGVNAVVSDLSLGGACVSDFRRRLDVGSETLMTLRPRVENVSLRARAVWIAPMEHKAGYARLGFKFLGSLAERTEALEDFLPRLNF